MKSGLDAEKVAKALGGGAAGSAGAAEPGGAHDRQRLPTRVPDRAPPQGPHHRPRAGHRSGRRCPSQPWPARIRRASWPAATGTTTTRRSPAPSASGAGCDRLAEASPQAASTSAADRADIAVIGAGIGALANGTPVACWQRTPIPAPGLVEKEALGRVLIKLVITAVSCMPGFTTSPVRSRPAYARRARLSWKWKIVNNTGSPLSTGELVVAIDESDSAASTRSRLRARRPGARPRGSGQSASASRAARGPGALEQAQVSSISSPSRGPSP